MNSSPPLTGKEMQLYRASHGLSREKLGEILGGKSGVTIKRWEEGQEIPGDSEMLLKLLIRGERPFEDAAGPSPMRRSLLELEMRLEAFEKLQALALAGGYDTVTDYIGALVAQHLAEESSQKRPGVSALPSKREDEIGLVAEEAAVYGAGLSGSGDADEKLLVAAQAFEAETASSPPPIPASLPRAVPARRRPGSPGQGVKALEEESLYMRLPFQTGVIYFRHTDNQ